MMLRKIRLDSRIDSYAGGTVRWWMGYNDLTVEGLGLGRRIHLIPTGRPMNPTMLVAAVKTAPFSTSSVLVEHGTISIAIPLLCLRSKSVGHY